MYKLRKNKKIIITLLLFIFLLTPILQTKVEAHNAVFLSSTIDTLNKQYVIDVMEDKVGFSKEDSHLESKIGNFSNENANMISSLDNPVSPWSDGNLGSHEEQIEREKLDGDATGDNSPWNPEETSDYRLFTFPTMEESSRWIFGSKNHATSEDTDRAFSVGSQLNSSLSGLLSFVNDGRKFKSVDHLILTSILIRPTNGNIATVPGKNGAEYQITYHKPSDKAWVNEDGSVKAFVEKIEAGDSAGDPDNESMTFIYAIPKGYIPIKDGEKPIVGANSEMYQFAEKALDEPGKHDTPWLTIHHLTAQANHAHTIGISYQTGRPEAAENVITRAIKGFLVDILYGLLNKLGLYEIGDIIYNKGIKASSIYSNGLMTTSWWAVVVRYHMMSQYLAVIILIGAIIKTLIQVNYSTINPAVRMYLYKIFERLGAVAVLLVGIIPITLFMVGLNNSLVDIFATQVDLSSTSRAMTHGGAISGLLIEFFFLAMTFYINFVYIMRNFTIALLIASAPLFIVSMAFTYQTRGLFDNFIKELIANIFLQAFHAFSFAFIFNLQAQSRGIEGIVAVAMLVPLTEVFREWVFGRAGGGTLKLGQTAGQATYQGAKGVGKNLVGGAAGGIAAGIISKDPDMGPADKDLGGMQTNQGYTAQGNRHRNVGASLGATLGAKKMKDGLQKREEEARHKNGKPGLAGLGAMAQGVALSSTSGMGETLDGISDVAGGVVFGNQRAVMSGVDKISDGVGAGVASATGAAGTIGGTLVGEFKENRNEAKLKSGNRDAIHKINPVTAVTDQGNGTHNITYDGEALKKKGFSDIGTINNGKGMALTFDSYQGGFTKQQDINGEVGIKATPEGEAMARILTLNGSEEGREILRNEVGIDSVTDLGGGKHRIEFNEKYMADNGINNVQKAQSGGNLNINRSNSSIAQTEQRSPSNPQGHNRGATESFIPNISEEQVKKSLNQTDNPNQLRPEEIINKSERDHKSDIYSRDRNADKWNNFKVDKWKI